MPKIDGKEISREVLAEAMRCDTPEALMKLAKEHGIEFTVEEAEAYLSEFDDIELDSEMLKSAAGGGCYSDCNRCETKGCTDRCKGH
ncbi:hypothetical protein [Selenomonas sp. KH1T6]|uniref:hypothetical protein n=1 Tax=Selenomonas sp. KH1T6 TaxID=3158784 RepID=UPI0008A7D641|nr:nif11-like leader peptide domain-containing protein [Selenomonas ruminantium]